VLAALSVKDFQSHSSVEVEDPATGCSRPSVSCFLFFTARFLGESCGVLGVKGVESSLPRTGVAAATGCTVSTGTGITVVDADKVYYTKKLAGVYEFSMSAVLALLGR
jgi:hypothetical protein